MRRGAPRRRRWGLALGGLALLGLLGPVGVGASLALWARDDARPTSSASSVREPRGAYHVHSRRSDGKGTEEEIAHAAALAGLDFVVLTDHNLLELPAPRFVEGVLLVPGVELSTPSGHVVALGLARGLSAEERQGPVLQTVAERGGTSVLAHPVQRHWPWRDWASAPLANGLEVLSWDTMFRQALARPWSRLLPAAGAFAVRPTHALAGLLEDDPGARLRLLSLTRPERPEVALCAHDAHGFPAYGALFEVMRLHLPGPALPQQPAAAAASVVRSLREGSAYCGFDGLGDTSGFELRGMDAARRAPVGASLRARVPGGLGPGVRLRVEGPAHLEGDGLTVRLEGPGAVQVEVWRKSQDLFLRDVWKPWIVPSPVAVVPGTS